MKREVKQFVIGTDFTSDEIELLILRLTNWFKSPECDRRFEDPENEARNVVEQCLNGTTKSGDPWRNAPNDFAVRIKTKAMYNMADQKGIPVQAVKAPHAVRRLEKDAKDNKSKINDMQAALMSFDMEGFRSLEESKLLANYPELNNPVCLPHVRRLTLLYAQQEMIDLQLQMVPNNKNREDALKQMEVLNKTTESVLKILDIHPESVRKKIKESADGTLGELVAVLEADDEFKAREHLWSLQAALQLWSMTVRRNGRGDGPQLTEWEVWHATRSTPMEFTCRCGAHYPRLIRGFTPKELKEYLLKNGVLIEQPAIPRLITTDDVVGLSEFIDALPEDNGKQA